MSHDIITLTPAMPDLPTLMAALLAAGPDLRIEAPKDGGVIQLYDNTGGLLFRVEVPIYVQVPGEAQRLLGQAAAGLREPLWWTETRAIERPGADQTARTFADALVRRLGGTVVTFDEAGT